MKKTLFLLLLLPAIYSKAQIKQRSAIQGFSTAIDLHIVGWTSEYFQYLDENASSGVGGGLWFGYGVNEMFEPYAGFDITTFSTSKIDAKKFLMLHADAGLRVNFAGTVHPARPFVEAGYSYVRAFIKEVVNGSDYVDVLIYGGKPHVGGGINYFFKVPISAFARGVFTVGKKSSARLDGEDITDKPDVTTFRVCVGVKFNFSALSKNK